MIKEPEEEKEEEEEEESVEEKEEEEEEKIKTKDELTILISQPHGHTICCAFASTNNPP